MLTHLYKSQTKMKTAYIPTIYHLKWRLKNEIHIAISTNKTVINTKTGRILKETINGGYTKGYWIGKKFIPTTKMNKFIEIIPNIDCPF